MATKKSTAGKSGTRTEKAAEPVVEETTAPQPDPVEEAPKKRAAKKPAIEVQAAPEPPERQVVPYQVQTLPRGMARPGAPCEAGVNGARCIWDRARDDEGAPIYRCANCGATMRR